MSNLPRDSQINKDLISKANDEQHWFNLKPPLAPNEQEVDLYKKLIDNSQNVCMLGMTKELVPLCSVAVDLYPKDIGKPTIQCEWGDLYYYDDYGFDAVISDGGINLTSLGLVDNIMNITNKFICRVFMAKQLGMKYATFFPTEFPGSTQIIVTQPDIAIVVWERL